MKKSVLKSNKGHLLTEFNLCHAWKQGCIVMFEREGGWYEWKKQNRIQNLKVIVKQYTREKSELCC